MISLLVKGIASFMLSVAAAVTPGVVSEDTALALEGVSDKIAMESIDAFGDYHELKEICACESNLIHYKNDGSVLRGNKNKEDIGICQINQLYHKKRINDLGINIYTEQGNIEFAKRLYDSEGSGPWIWSKPCWSKRI